MKSKEEDVQKATLPSFYLGCSCMGKMGVHDRDCGARKAHNDLAWRDLQGTIEQGECAKRIYEKIKECSKWEDEISSLKYVRDMCLAISQGVPGWDEVPNLSGYESKGLSEDDAVKAVRALRSDFEAKVDTLDMRKIIVSVFDRRKKEIMEKCLEALRKPNYYESKEEHLWRFVQKVYDILQEEVVIGSEQG